MSYQVIARKYRPQRFEDVVGQDHVTQTLTNAIRSGRIAHAYLFCGPRGTGKTTIARLFAKALNCTDGPRADFDPADPKCAEIAEGRSLDVLEIDGASNNGVEQVRELRETARFAPASSRFKLYIIDEVHMLSTAAFNALLKTLEEPPAHVKFLFATTDPEKVLPTILSRCQRFDLRRIPSEQIVRHLAAIAAAEGVTVTEPALRAIARGADGGMRDAESTLDQLISFCGEQIDEPDVLSMFGLAARSQIFALARALLEGDAATMLTEFNTLARNGKDLGRLLHDLLHHFRNLMVCQLASGDLDLLDLSDTDRAELKDQSTLAPPDAVTRVLDVLTSAEGRLRDAVARKILLEVTFMKAIQARHAVSLDAVLRQLNLLRQEAGLASPAPGAPPGASPPAAASRERPIAPATALSPPLTPPPPPMPAPAPARIPPAKPESPKATSAPSTPAAVPEPAGPDAAVGLAGPAQAEGTSDPVALWEQVVAAASPMSKASLAAGQPLALENGVLTVGYATGQDFHLALVDQDRTKKAVNARLESLGCRGGVKFIRLPAQAASPAATGSSAGADPEQAGPQPGGLSPTASPAAPGSKPADPAPRQAAASKRAKAEKVAPMKIDPAEFKNDPLIKEALELFKGQLIEVRGPTESEG